MLLPLSILRRMGLNFAGAGAMLVLNAPRVVFAGETSAPATQTAATEPLNAQQLEMLKASIPLLGAEDFSARVRASKTIQELGAAVVSHLKAAMPRHKDPEIRVRLQRIISHYEPSPALNVLAENYECPGKCGQG